MFGQNSALFNEQKIISDQNFCMCDNWKNGEPLWSMLLTSTLAILYLYPFLGPFALLVLLLLGRAWLLNWMCDRGFNMWTSSPNPLLLYSPLHGLDVIYCVDISLDRRLSLLYFSKLPLTWNVSVWLWILYAQIPLDQWWENSFYTQNGNLLVSHLCDYH